MAGVDRAWGLQLMTSMYKLWWQSQHPLPCRCQAVTVVCKQCARSVPEINLDQHLLGELLGVEAQGGSHAAY